MRTLATFLSLTLFLTLLGAPATGDDKTSPTRWEKEIAAFEQQEKDSPPAKDGVIFIGSSSVRMWKLDRSFPDLHALNRGFGGSQLPDSVFFAPRLLYKQQPRIVVLYAGDNDLAAGKTPEQVSDAFKEFVAVVRKELTKTKIIYLSIKPSPSRVALMDKARKANALIAETCKKEENVVFVDVVAPMLGEDGKPREELFLNDKLHMNEKGYAIWAELLKPLLK